MSILPLIAEVAPPTLSPTTAPTDAPTGLSLAYAFGMIAVALTIAAALRVFRPRSIEGPPRLAPGIPARPLFLVTLLAAGAWIFTQVVYVHFRAAQLAAADPTARFGPEHFTSQDFALLSTVPFFIGFVIFVIGDAMLGRGMVRRLGYNLRRLPLGLLVALLAMLVVFPLMIGGGILLELAYRAVDYQHPDAHELLTAMKKVSSTARIMMIIGAVVGAPLFEELLFRGHIQTLLVRLFSAIGARWAAVVITSILFAVIHPLWMAPLIFLLALCLGYAYERTGNLWVPILMHAFFNGGQTLYFLYAG